ncbi:244_t:CDS:2, partial [Scutellospora calospora]
REVKEVYEISNAQKASTVASMPNSNSKANSSKYGSCKYKEENKSVGNWQTDFDDSSSEFSESSNSNRASSYKNRTRKRQQSRNYERPQGSKDNSLSIRE